MVERLRELGEIEAPDEIIFKLKMMSPSIVDRKLKHQREYLHLLRSKRGPRPGYLLKQKIPHKAYPAGYQSPWLSGDRPGLPLWLLYIW